MKTRTLLLSLLLVLLSSCYFPPSPRYHYQVPEEYRYTPKKMYRNYYPEKKHYNYKYDEFRYNRYLKGYPLHPKKYHKHPSGKPGRHHYRHNHRQRRY